MAKKELPEMPTNLKIENDKDLFSLFYILSKYLKEYEELTAQKRDKETGLEGREDNVNHPILFTLTNTILYTLLRAIPFLIIFFIVTNVIRTDDGRAFWYACEKWMSSTPIIRAIFAILPDTNSVIINTVILLFKLILIFFIEPCITILMPLSFVASVITTIRTKTNLPTMKKEFVDIEKEVEEMEFIIDGPLTFVPPDYRTSDALEYFCRCYVNGKVSNLKEAIDRYDVYRHRQEMERVHNEISSQQIEILKNVEEIKKRKK